MNKSELIDLISNRAKISKTAANEALEAVLNGIGETLKSGGTVSLMRFGTFSVRQRKARTGRNPKTGEAIKIKESKVPTFKAGIGLKQEVQ